jgi:hypothetical protein
MKVFRNILTPRDEGRQPEHWLDDKSRQAETTKAAVYFDKNNSRSGADKEPPDSSATSTGSERAPTTRRPPAQQTDMSEHPSTLSRDSRTRHSVLHQEPVPPPLVSDTDTVRTIEKYETALQTLKAAIRSRRRDIWMSFEIPELEHISAGESWRNIQTLVNQILAKRGEWVKNTSTLRKVNGCIKRIFTALGPAVQNFLKIAREGQSVCCS